eukprot:g11993.t1
MHFFYASNLKYVRQAWRRAKAITWSTLENMTSQSLSVFTESESSDNSDDESSNDENGVEKVFSVQTSTGYARSWSSNRSYGRDSGECVGWCSYSAALKDSEGLGASHGMALQGASLSRNQR